MTVRNESKAALEFRIEITSTNPEGVPLPPKFFIHFEDVDAMIARRLMSWRKLLYQLDRANSIMKVWSNPNQKAKGPAFKNKNQSGSQGFIDLMLTDYIFDIDDPRVFTIGPNGKRISRSYIVNAWYELNDEGEEAIYFSPIPDVNWFKIS